MILFLYFKKPFYIHVKLFEEIPWEFKTPSSMECISQTQIGTFEVVIYPAVLKILQFQTSSIE